MAESTTKSKWQYAQWAWNIARNMRITEPTEEELGAVRDFIKAFRNPIADTGTRPWLDTDLKQKCVSAVTEYEGDIDAEPTHVIVEMLQVVARSLRKQGVTDAEAAFVDTLISQSDNRRYGTGPLFGGAPGSLVTIPGLI